MTARTKSFLQGSYFQDGQAAGSIVPLRLRDFIDTVFSMAPVSVMDYGAVGDGTTDDSAAIQSAINAVSGSGSGCGMVRFPAAPGGAYLIKSALTLPMGVSLIGEVSPGWADGFDQSAFATNAGSPCRINAASSLVGAMINLDASANRMMGMGIINLVIDGRGTAGGGAFPGDGLICYNGSTFRERRLFMWNCEITNSVGDGIQINGQDGVMELSHVHINRCQGNGIDLANGAGDVTLDHLYIRGCGTRANSANLVSQNAAVSINEGSTVCVNGGRIEENYGFGVLAKTSGNTAGPNGSRSTICVFGTVFEHNDLAALCASSQGQSNARAVAIATGAFLFGNGFNASAYTGLTADDWTELRADGYGRVIANGCFEQALGEGVPTHFAYASGGGVIDSNMNCFTDTITTPYLANATAPAGVVNHNGDINGI